MIALPEYVRHRTTPFRIAIQDAMQPIRRQAVGQFLGSAPMVNADEGIVGHGVADAFRA
jgi:hypothetical protein